MRKRVRRWCGRQSAVYMLMPFMGELTVGMEKEENVSTCLRCTLVHLHSSPPRRGDHLGARTTSETGSGICAATIDHDDLAVGCCLGAVGLDEGLESE